MQTYLRYLACLGVALTLLLGVSMAQTNGNSAIQNQPNQPTSNVQTSNTNASTNAYQTTKALSAQDQAFARKAADINLGEVALGQLARQKASMADVKDLGRIVQQDHATAQQQLKMATSSLNLTLPAQPSAHSKQMKQDLSSQSGTQFDQAFVRDMDKGHDQAIQAFENEIENGQNAQLKQYAENQLPVIQDHIRLAENLAGRMKLSGKMGLNDQAKAITAGTNQQTAQK